MVADLDYDKLRKRVEKRLRLRAEFYGHLVTFILVNAGAWFAWASGLTFGWDLMWPLVLSLLWGSGVIGHFCDAFIKADARPNAVFHDAEHQMRALYGDDWRNEADPDIYNSVRKNARKQIDKRAEFFQHILIFLPIITAMFVIWDNGWKWDIFGIQWIYALAGLWGIGLVFHGMDALFHVNEARILREVHREMERERGKSKSKRKQGASRAVRLTDDGELEDEADVYFDHEAARDTR